MILETVLFTALPRARKGNELLLSVLISPQLGGEEGRPARLPLSRYADFREGRWAQIVAGIEWDTVLRWSRDDADEDYLTTERISPDPDVDLFALMFPTDMPVDPFTFSNAGDAQILSYPAGRLADELDSLQETIARQSGELRPVNDALVTRKGSYGRLPLDGFVMDAARRQRTWAEIERRLADAGVLTTPDQGTEGTALATAMLERTLAPSITAGQPSKPLWPDLDFHEVVSALQSHPNLLRRLGLLVDLRATLSGVRARTGTPRVYVGSDWPPPYDPDAAGVDITTVFPRVRTTLTNSYFRPAPRGDSLTDDGYADLGSARAITSAIESEVLATETTATDLARMMTTGLETYGTPERSAVPARSSVGVEIARRDEAAALRLTMREMTEYHRALATGDDVLLDAEDVVLGYRVDVKAPRSDGWRSLHRRRGTLTPYTGRTARSPIDLGEDEGWSEPASSHNPEDGQDGRPLRLRLRESLAVWTGWSLALPKPGRSLGDDDQPTDDVTAAEAPDLIDSMHGTIDYAAPAAGARLPALRFSAAQYQARLRWVDLAGSSLEPDAEGGSILPFYYQRHDPVSFPDMVYVDDPVWAEAADVLVVRTGNLPKDNRRQSQRWIAPPKVAASLCVTHGMFDDARGVPRPDTYATIAERESASLAEGPLAADPGAVPYLPDPLAEGLFVRGIPTRRGAYSAEASLSYRGAWPAREVAQIVLDGSRANGAAVTGDRLVVGLEPGRVAHLRVSHSLSASGLSLMDLWRRIRSFARQDRARKGAYWQLTPDRLVVAVHAVQRPVSPPKFVTGGRDQSWKASRAAGDAAATLAGKITVDQPSTQALNILGLRTYAVDDGPSTAPPAIVSNAPVGVLATEKVEDPAPGGGQADVQVRVRATLPDTRRSTLALEAEAVSRFAEHFRQSMTTRAVSTPITINGGREIAAGTVRITYVSGDATVTAPETAYSVDVAGGKVTLNPTAPAADRIPLGIDLTISYVPGPITRLSSESSVTPASRRRVSVAVPSSARPQPPQAEWILPTFEWSGPTGSDRRSTRRGAGLRLYLARPWYSSGLGEELAVVLRPQGAQSGRDEARDALVTQWGRDAITVSGSLPVDRYPRPEHFTNGEQVARGVRMAEVDAPVDIVRYPVGAEDSRGNVLGYDAERDMWYVDIVVNPGTAYRPFLRLALARYQPVSVSGLNLSPVTLVDVVQLEPDRFASVAVSSVKGRRTARISLTGRSYVRNDAGAGPGPAVAILEKYEGPRGPKVTPSSLAVWTPQRSVQLNGRVTNSGEATWTGNVDLPSAGSDVYRIVLEQYESHRSDGSSSGSGAKLGSRLVHQDIIGI